MFWIKHAVLCTPYKHTEVMRLLQDAFKDIYHQPGNFKPLEGYTTHKKFEVKMRSWPLKRNDHPYAMGLVEEDGSGSLIRLKMWMDPFILIIVAALSLAISSMVVYNLFEAFEWGKIAGFGFLILPMGFYFVFYLMFAYEFRVLSRNLCGILNATKVKSSSP